MDIDKMLVVTFTNAAASEMRQRILEAIYKKMEQYPEDRHLQRQVILLNKASICTIHSFCLDVIRNHFYEIDTSANFRVGDTAEIELLKQDILEDVFEEKYEEQEEEFINLIHTYTSYRDDQNLKDLVLNIYEYIQSSPWPEKWLEEKIEMFRYRGNEDFAETVWGEILVQEIKEIFEEATIRLEKTYCQLKRYSEAEKFANTIWEDFTKVQKIEEKLHKGMTWDEIYVQVNELNFDKWPIDKKCAIEQKEIAKKVRDDMKDKIKAMTEKILLYTSKEAFQDMEAMYQILKSLQKVIFDFGEQFAQAKKQRNLIDFHDIEHFALKILEKEEVTKKYQEQFIEIAIDEYQDSNLVQEYILNSVSRGNNIFMVGDVKQSIYKFRQARPELFLEKYETYKKQEEEKEAPGKKIQLFKNFRSRENILDITNLVFQDLMSKKVGDIDYTEEEYLNLGANYEPLEQGKSYAGKTELHILNLANQGEDEEEEEDQEIEKVLLEANFVANKIEELLQSGYQVFDRKKGYRNITYKDIVILLRTTSNVAPVYEKSLLEKGIPVFSDISAEYLESTEIQTILSVLKIMDNPLNDIPLVTVLRSQIANFTDNELVQIRLADKSENFFTTMKKAKLIVEKELKEKIEAFEKMLESWKEEEKEKSLDELIWGIYTKTNYYHYVGLLTNGALRQANLRMLFERAKQYETASFKGLFNFIHFIDKVKTSSKDMSTAKIIGENENVVRIMSIHKSKGLEFPVVFLCGTGKRFNLQDLNNPVLMDQELGLGPTFIDEQRRIEYNTLAKEALRRKLKVDVSSEELRVLYVAMTRAKEKLFITGVEKDLSKSMNEKEELLSMYEATDKIEQSIVKKYISYLDWLELVYLFHQKSEQIMEFYEHSYKEGNKKEEKKEKENCIETITNKAKQMGGNKEIKQTLEWQYNHKIAQTLPTKTSVTKIKEMKLDTTLAVSQNEETINVEKEMKVPKFMQEEKITNAKKGTLVHLCVQKLDETQEYDKEKIEQVVEELYKKEIITKQEKEAVDIQSIVAYTKSKLWKELKEAKEIHKEEAFYIEIPAKEIYEEQTIKEELEEKILVQGMIDLYFINKDNEIILVDFKTDYLKKGEEERLAKKYAEQLRLYKEALESASGRKVKETYLYSMYLQELIKI